jgi:dual specificity tyrosine-phosphorylation-regulated kinase 2/3/4
MSQDPENKHSMINFTQSFYFRGHLCISTELLSINLYEFIKAHEFKGFPLVLIRRFTKQILSSLMLLKGKRVIHCDLKPENILLAHPIHSEIKVIDFGSSCFENEKVYTYIQSRFYRSPEVILGMSYGIPIDMWSLGCILAELYTGYPIFPGENEQEQLACIMEIFGPPEKHLIEKSSRKKLFFDSMGKPRVTVSSKGRRRRPSSKTLQSAIKCDDEPFLDFLAQCLRWDPDKRLKPDQALAHEFLTGIKQRPQPQQHQHGQTLSSRSRPGFVPASSAGPSASPAKRFASTSAVATPRRDVSGSSRPLPEPPGSFRGPANRASPVKNAQQQAQRRLSTTVSGAPAGTPAALIPGPPGQRMTSGAQGPRMPRQTRPVGSRDVGGNQAAQAAAAAAVGVGGR